METTENQYNLFYYPGHASLAPHILLNELDIDYMLHYVDIKNGRQYEDEYLKVNPLNQIPSLIVNDLVITESAAICLWIALEKGVLKNNDPLQIQWMFFLSNTVQSIIMDYHYPELREGEADNIKQQSKKLLHKLYRYISEHLGNCNTIGTEFSISDIYLFMLMYWSRGFIDDFDSIDNVKRSHKFVMQRESVSITLKKEGLSSYLSY